MTKEQAKRLAELVAKKKSQKLDDSEYAEYKELLALSKNKDGKEKKKKDPKPIGGPGNDFSWWNKLGELTRDSASFKSNFVPGRTISSKVPYLVPGVVSIQLETCWFPGNDAVDPVNVWARDLYLKMFQKYRPASGYTAADLGIAIMAGLEAVKLIAVYERIYGIINRYSARNVNMPSVEAKALGLTSTQLQYLQDHLSDFRYDLNYLIRKAQRLCIPKDISFIADAISLFGYEYLDHDNPRAQLILFNLISYGVYDDVSMQSGGSIQYNPSLLTDLFDFNAGNMCKALTTVLNGLLGSDSIQRIYADLVVWFGDSAMLQFAPVPEDYIVVPVYSKEILHKMHNLETPAATSYVLTSIIDAALSAADQAIAGNGVYHVYQVDDRIVTAGAFHTNYAATPEAVNVQGHPSYVLTASAIAYMSDEAHLIDGFEVDVNEEFVVEATLFKFSASQFAGTGYATIIGSCVGYIPRSIELHDSLTSTSYVNVDAPTTVEATAGHLAVIDWAPLAYGYPAGLDVFSVVYGDVDVIIPLSKTDLQRIQRTCFLSGLLTEAPVINK